MNIHSFHIPVLGLAFSIDSPIKVAHLGIDSVMCPIEQRKLAWSRLAVDLDHKKLSDITQEIGLDQVIAAGAQILAGQVRGRIVVKIA